MFPATEQETGMQHEVKGGTTPILEITLSPGDEVIAESGELAWMRGPVQLATSMGAGQQKSGFVGAEPGVELNVHMQQKIGAGIFGGAGFILQRLSGQGLAFVEMTGDVIE